MKKKKNCQAVFQNVEEHFAELPSKREVPVVSDPRLHLVWSTFCMLTFLVSVKWYLRVVFICIFLMTNMLDTFSCACYPFAYILLITVCSCLESILNELFIFLSLICKCVLCTAGTSLPQTYVSLIFSQFTACLFILLTVSLMRKSFSF